MSSIKLNKYEEQYISDREYEITYNNFYYDNSGIYTINLFKRIMEIDEKYRTKFFLHNIIYQDEEYIKNIYPYNYLFCNCIKYTDDSEYYNKLSHCKIRTEHIINSNKKMWNYRAILNNEDIGEEVILYILQNKLYREQYDEFRIIYNTSSYRSYKSFINFRNNNMKNINYEFILENCSDLLIDYLSTACDITDNIILENFRYIDSICINSMINVKDVINYVELLIPKSVKYKRYRKIFNRCLTGLSTRKDFTIELLDRLYKKVYDFSIIRTSYYDSLYIEVLNNSRYVTIDDILNVPNIYDYSELCDCKLDLSEYIENKYYHDNLFEKFGLEIYTHSMIDKENIIRLLKDNGNYEKFSLDENLLNLLYLCNSSIDKKFMKDNFNFDVSIDKYSTYCKRRFIRDIKEIHEIIHRLKFRNKINEELISKSCSPKRMYSWNEFACEEFPEEYAKECEKYRNM